MNDVPKLLMRFDVGIIPKRRSSGGWLPLKLFEYMASGLPIIAADVKSLGDFVRNNGVGLVYNPESPDELKNCILNLYNNRGNLVDFSNRAQSLARNHYDWEIIGDALIDVFSKT